jgi:hypothetical protein
MPFDGQILQIRHFSQRLLQIAFGKTALPGLIRFTQRWCREIFTHSQQLDLIHRSACRNSRCCHCRAHGLQVASYCCHNPLPAFTRPDRGAVNRHTKPGTL